MFRRENLNALQWSQFMILTQRRMQPKSRQPSKPKVRDGAINTFNQFYFAPQIIFPVEHKNVIS